MTTIQNFSLFGCDITIDGNEIFIDMVGLGNMENLHASNLRQKIFNYCIDEGILEEYESQLEK